MAVGYDIFDMNHGFVVDLSACNTRQIDISGSCFALFRAKVTLEFKMNKHYRQKKKKQKPNSTLPSTGHAVWPVSSLKVQC